VDGIGNGKKGPATALYTVGNDCGRDKVVWKDTCG